MFLNISEQPQAVLDRFLVYKIIYPNEVVDSFLFPDVRNIEAFKIIKKLDFSDYKTILIKRGHALGDIILSFPLMNYLRKLGKIVRVYTDTRYDIRGVSCISGSSLFDYSQFDLILNLDGILERDHIDKKLFKINRVDIYNRFLNLKNIGNDWSIDYPNIEVDLKGASVGIQIGGSKDYKSIKLHPLMKELDDKGIKFYIIDNTTTTYSYKNRVCIPTDVLGLLNIIKRLKGVLTFDSAPLWLSHVTSTPAFVIVGPTSQKVITRHPNKKSTFYDTKKDYGCKLKHGCGESAEVCDRKFSCMKNVNYKRLIPEFITWMEKL